MGVITTKKSLVQLEKLSTASFCRRRLSVIMVRLKMSETLREACTFIEQGHVRVGPDTGEAAASSARTPAWARACGAVVLWNAALPPARTCPHPPAAVTDPAFLVTRSMEDFVTWWVPCPPLHALCPRCKPCPA